MRAGFGLIGLIATTALAHAQPGVQPPAPPAPSIEPHTVMSRRWAIALGLGSESMRATPSDAQTLAVATIEISGRFRIRPAIELGLTLAGGGSYDGNYRTSSIAADFRYRFLAERALNAYALAGIGVATASGKDPSDLEKKGRGLVHLGGGGELRFDPLAVFAELRLYGIGENKGAPDPVVPSTRNQLARYGVSGIQLVLGATFYF